jgi:hypothetical protein
MTFVATAGTRRQAHDSEDRRIAAALRELGAAGLRVAYVGRDLGEGKATSVIVVPAETEDQARERIVSLFALRADDAAQLRVHQGPQTIRRRTSAPTS